MIIFTTLNEIKKIVNELDLKMECKENYYTIYCPVPDHFHTHLFLGSTYKENYGLIICEFSTKGNFVWNNDITYLTGIKSSTDHHWTAWAHPVLFTRPKSHLLEAKKYCENLEMDYKQDILKKNIESMESDFA